MQPTSRSFGREDAGNNSYSSSKARALVALAADPDGLRPITFLKSRADQEQEQNAWR
jgi:hypothetical protein